MPPTPPSADASPNDHDLLSDRLMPETAALVSLSRRARIARPGRLLTRLCTFQNATAAPTAHRKYFHTASASRSARSPSPKYCPISGMPWRKLARPLIGNQLGGSNETLTILPPAPPVYSDNASSCTIAGNTAASPSVTRAR